ncbi:MAG TPA: hypothetical protein PKL15_19790, partial [Saprospiraceae bacterium]|nr:hypothetical protein [Saprospiraceae bacterium]
SRGKNHPVSSPRRASEQTSGNNARSCCCKRQEEISLGAIFRLPAKHGLPIIRQLMFYFNATAACI